MGPSAHCVVVDGALETIINGPRDSNRASNMLGKKMQRERREDIAVLVDVACGKRVESAP